MEKIIENIGDRVWRYVDRNLPSESCWLWRGHIQRYPGKRSRSAIRVTARDLDDYDFESVFGSLVKAQGSIIPAPRVMWGLLKGNVPADKLVVNTCGTELCVNPSHHVLGVNQTVTSVMVAQERVPRGEEAVSAILTDQVALQIYDEWTQGDVTNQELASRWNIPLQSVKSITVGSTWSTVTGAKKRTWRTDSAKRVVRRKPVAGRFRGA
jgi:hypothetical protein